jgi:hypothetical protein
MLEGLPPNNAAHKLSLVSDERRARQSAIVKVTSLLKPIFSICPSTG